MNAKLISIVIVLLMVAGSFIAVGTNTDENDCECSTSKRFISFYDGDNPTELGLIDGIDPNGKSSDDFLGRKLAGEIFYDGFDWRDAKLDENGHGIPGYGSGYDWTTGVRDQGYCGSCYAFASLASLEGIIKLDSRNPNTVVDLSEQYVVSCGKDTDGIYGCCGAYYTSSLQFVKWNEVISEDCFGYEGIDSTGRDAGDCNSYPSNDPVACKDGCSSVVGVESWFSVRSQREQIQLALIQYGPLVTAMYVPGGNNYSGFRNYPTGINTDENYVYKHSSGDYTNHMICIVGYCNDATADYDGYWICKNSWGADWGLTKDGEPNNGDDGGWFRIAYNSCNIEQKTAYFVLEGVQLSADMPKGGLVDESLHFSAEATDGFEPYTYTWDFGDGEIKAGKSVTHTYDEPGVYLVTVNVKDSRPNGADTETIIEEIRIYENPPTIDVTINQIKELDCIDPDIVVDNPAEWYYKIFVKDHSEDEWDSITSDIIKGDDVIINKIHSFVVLEKKVDVKIKLMEKDNLTEGGRDDLADISNVSDPYYNNDDYDDFYYSNRTDLENYTSYMITYDITSGTKSYTANGEDDRQSGDQNDAELKFEIESRYMPVNSAKVDTPRDGELFATNEPVVFSGTASGGCLEVYSYEWDFSYTDYIWYDFNVEAKGSPTSHSFDRAMKHHVALRVRDGITEDISKIVEIDISGRPHNIQIEFKNDVSPRKFRISAEDDDPLKYAVDWNSDGDLNDDSEEWDDNDGNYYYIVDGKREPSGWFDCKNKPIPQNGEIRIVVEDTNGLQNEKAGVKAKSESKHSVGLDKVFLPFYSLLRYFIDFEEVFPLIYSYLNLVCNFKFEGQLMI